METYIMKPRIRKPQKPFPTVHLGTQWRIVVEARKGPRSPWTPLEVYADGAREADAYQALQVYCHDNKILVGKTLDFSTKGDGK